ncbi:hypothetical protein KY289_011072 [Solanum tuberosum]|nr:hypothetical protein KY289_011072 [Solanum tuberosum]
MLCDRGCTPLSKEVSTKGVGSNILEAEEEWVIQSLTTLKDISILLSLKLCKSHDPILNMSKPFLDKTTEIEAQIDLNQEEDEEDEQAPLTWKQTGRRRENAPKKVVDKGGISGVDKVAQVSEVPSVATRKHDDKGKGKLVEPSSIKVARKYITRGSQQKLLGELWKQTKPKRFTTKGREKLPSPTMFRQWIPLISQMRKWMLGQVKLNQTTL